ncbi:MAG: hypothetical protein AAFV85_11060 [Cyanobacteria bacterium J06634_6]
MGFSGSDLEETPKKLATPTCQKLGWLWHDCRNLHNCHEQFGGELSVLVPANSDSD